MTSALDKINKIKSLKQEEAIAEQTIIEQENTNNQALENELNNTQNSIQNCLTVIEENENVVKKLQEEYKNDFNLVKNAPENETQLDKEIREKTLAAITQNRKTFVEIFNENSNKRQTHREKINFNRNKIKELASQIELLEKKLLESKKIELDADKKTTEDKKITKPKKDEENEEIKTRKTILENTLSHDEWKLASTQEYHNKLVKNIQYAKEQLENITDKQKKQTIEYTREYYNNGEAKIISKDAEKYAQICSELPIVPHVAGRNTNKTLKSMGKSEDQINKFLEKEEELKNLKSKLYKEHGPGIEFIKTNVKKYPAFPSFKVGHGSYKLDERLLGTQMSLSDLLQKDIEYKQEIVSNESEKIEAIKQEISKTENELSKLKK